MTATLRPAPGAAIARILLLAFVVFAWAGPGHAAERVRISAVESTDYGRIVFEWPAPVGYRIGFDGDRLEIRFTRPLRTNFGTLLARLRSRVVRGVVSDAGRKVTLTLKGVYGLRHFVRDDSAVVIDLMDPPDARAEAPVADAERRLSRIEPAAGDPAAVTGRIPAASTAEEAPARPAASTGEEPPARPAAAPAPESPPARSSKVLPREAPAVRVRAGIHPGFDRLVFDWPEKVPFRLERDGRIARLVFERPARFDFAHVRRIRPPKVRGWKSAPEGAGVAVTVRLAEDGRVRVFRDGPRVVLDIRGPRRRPPTHRAADGKERKTGTAAASAAPGTRPDAGARAAMIAAAKPADAPAGDGPSDPGGVAGTKDKAGNGAKSESKHGERTGKETGTEKGASAPAVRVEGEKEKATKAKDGASLAKAPRRLVPPPSAKTLRRSGEATAGAAASRAGGSESSTRVAAAEPTPGEAAPDAPRFSFPRPITAPAGVTPIDRSEWEDGVALRFSWNVPTAAAVFMRGEYLWTVFDQRSRASLRRVKQSRFISSVDQLASRIGTIVRFKIARGLAPRVFREGLSWIVELSPRPNEAQVSLDVRPEPDPPEGPRLFIPLREMGTPMRVRDPEIGDRLLVVPVVPLGHGVRGNRRYAEFELLASAQGVVVRPLAESVAVNTRREGVEVVSADGLNLSDPSGIGTASAALGNAEKLGRLFNFDEWEHNGPERYLEDKHELQRKLALASNLERNGARLTLARFYFAHGYASAALGLLKLIEEDEPALLEAPDVRAMRGASHFIMQDYDRARRDLFHSSLDDVPEIGLWRGGLAAVEGDWPRAEDEFEFGGALIGIYPRHYRIRLALLAAESALHAANPERAKQLITLLEDAEPAADDAEKIRYLKGRYAALVGDPLKAIEIFEEVRKGPDPESRAKATLAEANLKLARNMIDPGKALAMLDRVRFEWRGGDFEFRLLRRMGQLLIESGDYRAGLETLRRAATYFPEHPLSAAVTEEMAAAFRDLYVGGKADDLPPLVAVALYDEFKELTPSGPEGEEMVRKLADRLVAVDLLDRAAELLAHQVGFRLEGEQKARVAARLAVIYLLDHKPQEAIDVLEGSKADGLPPDLVRQRRLLMAKALSEAGRTDEALALLDGDYARDADLVRAEIHWRAKAWDRAVETLERLVADLPGPGGRLTRAESETVLNLAVALTLDNDTDGLERLRARFLKAMGETPNRDAFRLLVGLPEDGVKDYRELADRVADVDTLQAFLAGYRERLQTGGLQALN